MCTHFVLNPYFRVSMWRPDILRCFSGFSQSLQADAGVVRSCNNGWFLPDPSQSTNILPSDTVQLNSAVKVNKE
jgi:hypothetical protein